METVLDFKSVFKKTYGPIKTGKKIIEFGTTNIKNDKMSDLIDRFAKKTQLDYLFSSLATFSNSVFQALVMPWILLVTTYPTSSNKKIDNFTDMIQSLSLLVCILERNISAFSVTLWLKSQLANTSSEFHMQTDHQETDLGKNC